MQRRISDDASAELDGTFGEIQRGADDAQGSLAKVQATARYQLGGRAADMDLATNFRIQPAATDEHLLRSVDRQIQGNCRRGCLRRRWRRWRVGPPYGQHRDTGRQLVRDLDVGPPDMHGAARLKVALHL